MKRYFKKWLFSTITIFLLLFSAVSYAEEAQPFSLPFKFDVNTLYDFQHKAFTAGLSVDLVSVYDTLFIGIEGVGASQEQFFSNGLVGLQSNVDINNAVMLLADQLKLGDNVKWLGGKYMPRIGVSVTYNFLQNSYYKDWNVFATMRLFSF